MLFILLTLVLPAVVLSVDNTDACNPDKMTVYRMVLRTFWTRDKFPKHYPDWRPPAQWSKIYGVSHDRAYVLFRLGKRVQPSVRQFAEGARSESLGNAPGTFDTFEAPGIKEGAGRTEAEFFVEGNHSRVSVMARIIPSPDWFIGVDSFDLCVDGNWLDSITVEVDPLDAGTDNGFTFTAPNWPTAPQGVAYRITSRYPAHPAGSFFYPHLRRLPPIATFQFIKLREYELSEVFHHGSDERSYDVVQLGKMEHNSIDVLDGNHALSVAEEEERAEQTPTIYAERTATTADMNYYAVMNMTEGTTEEPRWVNDLPTPPRSYQMSRSLQNTAGDRSALNSLARRYRVRRRRKMRPRTAPGDNADRRKRKRSKQDCRVSEWGEWSECSGEGCVGAAVRTRRIVHKQRPGGTACPATTQSRWCTKNCSGQPYRPFQPEVQSNDDVSRNSNDYEANRESSDVGKQRDYV